MTEPLSAFKTPAGESLCLSAYNAALACWPVKYEELDIPTRFGLTHIIASGEKEASPLVLLHGQQSSATSWLYTVASLSGERRVYAVDTIGDFGKSRLVRMPTNRAEYADWLMEVLEGLKIEQACLVGMSYGGFLALNFALAFPKRVERLALLAPGCPNLGAPTFWWAYYGMPMMLFPSRNTVRHFISGVSKKGYSSNNPIHEQMLVSVPEMRTLMYLRPSLSDDELKTIEIPVLLLVGDREILYNPHQALARAAQLFPAIQAELVPNAGHMVIGDQPEQVSMRILRFMRCDEKRSVITSPLAL